MSSVPLLIGTSSSSGGGKGGSIGDNSAAVPGGSGLCRGCGPALTEPWSKKHKHVTKAGAGGLTHSLSNSYAQPLTTAELISLSQARGDQALVEEYVLDAINHPSYEHATPFNLTPTIISLVPAGT